MSIEKLKTYAKNSSVVTLEYLDEEWHGEVVACSEDFVLLVEIAEFAYAGFVIFNKKYIKNITREKYERFAQKVVHKFAKKPKVDTKWLDLSSFETIFKSLKKHYNKFCIDTTDDKDNFFVGKIIEFDNDTLTLKALDTYANFEQHTQSLNVKDVGYILFADNYSKMLFKYNKQMLQKDKKM